MVKTQRKYAARIRRKQRARKKISGSDARPRLCIYRSNAHWYAQIVSDDANKTLVSASTVVDAVAEGLKSTANKEAAARVGKAIGERAVAAGISQVVFDKNGFLYHGRVKVLADAAREAGLKF